MTEQNNEQFEKKLTIDEIELEVNKIKDFFSQIPSELKSDAAERFIYETIIWGSRDHFQAIGILEEVKLRYREISLGILEEEREEERLEMAYENAVDYRCLVEVDWTQEDIKVGDNVKATYAGEDDRYAGEGRYDVFVEKTHTHYCLCKESFESHFQLIEES